VSVAWQNNSGITGTAAGSGPILDEAALTVRGAYGDTLDTLVIERLVVGVFFVGVKLLHPSRGHQ
jgi:hypothetical protein